MDEDNDDDDENDDENDDDDIEPGDDGDEMSVDPNSRLREGDLVSLRLSDVGSLAGLGVVCGDLRDRNVGVQLSQRQAVAVSEDCKTVIKNWEDCAFLVCPHLSFRALGEWEAIRRTVDSLAGAVGGEEKERGGLQQQQQQNGWKADLALAKTRMEHEKAENAELMERAQQSASATARVIQYGDVIMLMHRRSELFLAMERSPAEIHTNNLRVLLQSGSPSCFFRLLPRFKASLSVCPSVSSHSLTLTLPEQ